MQLFSRINNDYLSRYFSKAWHVCFYSSLEKSKKKNLSTNYYAIDLLKNMPEHLERSFSLIANFT